MKKLIIITMAILLTISIGLIVPILLNREASTSENNKFKVSDVTKNDNDSNPDNATDGQEDSSVSNNTTGLGKELETNRLNTPAKSKDSGVGTGDKSIKSNTSVPVNPKATSQVSPNVDDKGKKPQETTSKSVNNDGDTKPINDKSEDDQNTSEPKSWIDKKLDEYKNDIDPSDVPDIKRIYSKIDIGYVQGLSENGMTDEATNKIKEYLRKTLGSDYERAKELFYTYSYLL
ncbi:hypothetical protein [Pseudobacteroides cellulosolvens]|uniref:Uncharacterized protein n=1 Tax=Pseudobacteroides cellulosolvens ATCC 35603 = DSM 2933 TaxID=398512 RepID=A0A0L6JLF6_9FIRM|nr:hypothetical protein [Pseudobacteroides cellulosolvens]KNY26604.1 hypothetical protein Bccel_1869 [Pseudobacteroides cellulosolvens ATCC 35603 = DSM 2933]